MHTIYFYKLSSRTETEKCSRDWKLWNFNMRNTKFVSRESLVQYFIQVERGKNSADRLWYWANYHLSFRASNFSITKTRIRSNYCCLKNHTMTAYNWENISIVSYSTFTQQLDISDAIGAWIYLIPNRTTKFILSAFPKETINVIIT